jgi:site-specific DNA-methyltransferase (adenine-specific)
MKYEWGTPTEMFASLDKRFGPFTLDPCASASNAKCPIYYTREMDGLKFPWVGKVFMNPPYGAQIARWVQKAYLERNNCDVIVGLLPASTDTKWFHSYVYHKALVNFVKGRVLFIGHKNCRPNFPSMIAVWRPDRCNEAQLNLFER